MGQDKPSDRVFQLKSSWMDQDYLDKDTFEDDMIIICHKDSLGRCQQKWKSLKDFFDYHTVIKKIGNLRTKV